MERYINIWKDILIYGKIDYKWTEKQNKLNG